MDWMDNEKEIEEFVVKSMSNEIEKGKALVMIVRQLQHFNDLFRDQIQINRTIYNILDERKES